jgi:hypothetical protein
MNTKILGVIAAMTLIVSVSMAYATPSESLIQIGGVENSWLGTPAMDGIEGTTALLEQVALSENASVAPKPIPCPPVCPPPCPKGKVCPTPRPPTCCTPGRICVPKLPSCCPKGTGRCPIVPVK